jgi:hypothetical protein
MPLFERFMVDKGYILIAQSRNLQGSPSTTVPV